MRLPHGGPVEVYLAGTFRVARGGAPLAGTDLASRKARTLLKLLAVHRPGTVTADRIADVLWAGDPPADPARNVATLVSRLRRALGAEVIHGDPGGYRLAGPPAVAVDLDQAAQLTSRAERDLPAAPAIALTAAQRAIVLLSPGPALADEPDAAWAEPARHQLSGLLRRARHAAAAAATAVGDPGTAAGVAADAMAADPFDEAAHRLYMSACAAAGEPAKALACYADLSRRLADELGADPAPQTRDLHLAILREQHHGGGMPTGSGRPRAPGARPYPGRPQGPGALPDPGRPHGPRHGAAFGDNRFAPNAAPPSMAGVRLPGRDSELAGLSAAWERAASGEPGVLLIVGEAGIGKTRLAEEFAAEAAAAGATVLRARCYEAERSLFLQPVVESLLPEVTRMPPPALRELLGPAAPAFAALMPEAAAILGPGMPDAPPRESQALVDMERRRAFHAVTALLTGLAAGNPVLILLDDLQHAGQSTAEYLHYLARHAGGARLLAVVTLRAENEAETGAALAAVTHRIEVGPLAAGAVEQLARQAGQASQAGRILQRTHGHTLFVVESLRAVADGDGGLPESLRAAVQTRARRVGPSTEEMLRAAAVLGGAVDPVIVAAMLDLPPAEALRRCEWACQARLLVPAGRDFEFANDLIREALYDSTAEPARLAYHQRAADLLTGQPEALAYHAAAAGDSARAARAWLAASEEAFRRFAVSDSVSLVTQALHAAEQAGDLEVVARARVLRGRAHEVGSEFAAAWDDFLAGRSAAQAAGDTRQEILALRQLAGDVPVALGMPIGQCEEYLVRGLRLAELLGDRPAIANVLTRLAVISANRLRFDRALDYGARAAVVGRSASDGGALANGLDGLKTALGCLGRTPELAVLLDELEPLVRRLGDPLLLLWAVFESSFLQLAAGNWEGAAAAMESTVEMSRRIGYSQWEAWYLMHLGWLARVRGHDDEAMALGRQAVRLSEERPHTWSDAAACGTLGSTLLAGGRRDEAITLLERGLRAARQTGAESFMLRCLAPLAEATGSAAVRAEADRLLAGMGLPPGNAWVLGYETYLSVARAWMAAGDHRRAREVLAPLLDALTRTPWPAAEAAALVTDAQALASLGDNSQYRAVLDRAVSAAAKHGLTGVLRAANQLTSAG